MIFFYFLLYACHITSSLSFQKYDKFKSLIKKKRISNLINKVKNSDFKNFNQESLNNLISNKKHFFDSYLKKNYLNKNNLNNYSDFNFHNFFNRSVLTSDFLHKTLSHNPNNVYFFNDTKTLLIPDNFFFSNTTDSKLKTFKNKEHFKYNEFFFKKTELDTQSNNFYPASSCLKFYDNTGSGTVSLKYTTNVEINTLNSVFANARSSYFISLAMQFAFGFEVLKSISFSGVHKCVTDHGKDVRLFFKPKIEEVIIKKRDIFYNLKEKTIKFLDWNSMEKINFITEKMPIFYCVTEDNLELECSKSSFLDSDDYGNSLKISTINQST